MKIFFTIELLAVLLPLFAREVPALWFQEFAECMTGPVVGHDGEYCVHYDIECSPWHTGHVTLRTYARVQNMWPCVDPYGCGVNLCRDLASERVVACRPE